MHETSMSNTPDTQNTMLSTDAIKSLVSGRPAETKPLMRSLDPPQPYPIYALGAILCPAALRIQQVVQAPDAIVAQSILATATLAAQGYIDICIDGRRHPISQNFLTVGASGERKSAIDKIALQPIREHEEYLRSKYDEELPSYQRNKAAYEASHKEALGTKNKGATAKHNALLELGDSPKPPLEPIFTCEEPTYEGLIKSLQNGQPSIGIFSDEGGQLVGGHAFNSDNQLKTAAGLSCLWDGSPISRVRSGDGASKLYGRRLSTHLMIQPSVAQLLFSNQLLIDQGLLSRFLIAYPASTVGSRIYQEQDITNDPAIVKYRGRILSLLQQPLPLAVGKLNELKPNTLSLSEIAKALYITFHNTIESLTADGKQYSPIRGFANKAPEHACRLAGVLALVDEPSCTIINDDVMKRAIDLTRFYLDESLRLFHSGQTAPELVEAQRLLDWLKAKRKNIISTVEIYRYGPNSIRDAAKAKKIMGILFEHGWVTPMAGGVLFEDAVRKEAWQINPSLFDGMLSEPCESANSKTKGGNYDNFAQP